tara:strand:- start:1182 stop:1448 length:267 start_codon:yes stop_codon:yes gene_type:complete
MHESFSEHRCFSGAGDKWTRCDGSILQEILIRNLGVQEYSSGFAADLDYLPGLGRRKGMKHNTSNAKGMGFERTEIAIFVRIETGRVE